VFGTIMGYDNQTPCVPGPCPMTIMNGISFPNVHMTGNALSFENFTVTGDGNVTATGEVKGSNITATGATTLPAVGELTIGTSTATTPSCGQLTDSNGCLDWFLGTGHIYIPYFKNAATGTLDLTGATPTVATGHVGYGKSSITAGTGTCPSGVIGGQTVQGCLQINVGGTTRNLPYF
jgi:hypothetical protein